MSMQTLLLIIALFWLAIIFGGILLVIYFAGRRSVKNNPDKALIYVSSGKNIDKVLKANISLKTGEGECFAWKDSFIAIPKGYKEVYFKQRRLVFISRSGQLIASPFDTDRTISATERESLLQALLEANIGSGVVRALKGKGIKTMQLIMVAVIAFAIGAVGVYAVTHWEQIGGKTSQPPAIQQQVPNQPSIVEVK